MHGSSRSVEVGMCSWKSTLCIVVGLPENIINVVQGDMNE